VDEAKEEKGQSVDAKERRDHAKTGGAKPRNRKMTLDAIA
jgi:hypothetical protein